MNGFDEREIRDLLTPPPAPEPPADLAARIKNEIPGDLGVPVDDGIEAPTERTSASHRPPWRRQGWLIAASLVAVIGGVWLAGRVQHEPPAMTQVTRPWSEDAEVPERAIDVLGDRTSAPVAQGPISEQAKAESSGAGPARVDTVARQIGELEASDASKRDSPSSGDVAPSEAMSVPATPAPVHDARAAAIPSGERAVRTELAEREAEPAIEETITVTSESPLLDERAIATGSTILSPEDLAKIPTISRRVDADAVDDVMIDAPAPSAAELAVSTGENKERRARAKAKRAAPQRRLASPPPPAPRPPSRVTSNDAARSANAPPAPAAPVAAAPEPAAPGPAGGARDQNARLEEQNQRIAVLAAEAKRLEEELAALEADTEPAGMTFRDYGIHPFVETRDDALSTFALDVDTGAYNVVRRYVSDGRRPPASAVRVEELINRFDYGDAPPTEGDFALYAQGTPVHMIDAPRRYLLRLGVRARTVDDAARPPADLVFVVDVSGSMAQGQRLDTVRDALGLLVDQLGPDDRVGLVVYGSRGRVILPLVDDHDRIRRALHQLRPEGSTNAEEGLRLGYEMALDGQRPGTIRRVILCSDGVANVGRTDPESILSMVRHATDAGVELTTVGVGMSNYNDVLMEQLADQGNGRYAYVDDLDEARRIFVESLTGTLLTVAAEAKAQVAFNPETVARYRLIGYENRDVADADFRNDAVDAGEIGAGHAVTALYELELQPHLGAVSDADGWLANLTLRWGSVAQAEMVEQVRPVVGADFASAWDVAPPALRWCALVARFGETLRGVYGQPGLDLRTLHMEIERLSPDLYDRPDFVEFRDLVSRAAQSRR